MIMKSKALEGAKKIAEEKLAANKKLKITKEKKLDTSDEKVYDELEIPDFLKRY